VATPASVFPSPAPTSHFAYYLESSIFGSLAGHAWTLGAWLLAVPPTQLTQPIDCHTIATSQLLHDGGSRGIP